ncbi:MAG: DUF2085 domain-containing protein [Anaerolineales bacterium]
MSALTKTTDHLREEAWLRRLPMVLLFVGVLGAWLMYTPAGLLGKADAIGYAVCHRIDLRSFHLGDRPLPLCARCTGMYLGAILGMAYFALRGRGRAGLFPPIPVLVVLGAFTFAFGVDGVNSYLHFFPNAPHLYEPNNTLRLITGTFLGLTLASLVYAGFNQNAWRHWQKQAPLPSLSAVVPLLVLGGLIIGAVLSENDLILYPLALISAAGVLVLLTAVYTTMTLLVLRRENRAERWGELALPLMIGLTLAVAQVGAIDFVRYLATGTWAGFSL